MMILATNVTRKHRYGFNSSYFCLLTIHVCLKFADELACVCVPQANESITTARDQIGTRGTMRRARCHSFVEESQCGDTEVGGVILHLMYDQ
jgi:hypothetical protein